MSMRAWIALICISIFTVMFYTALWPAWIPLKAALTGTMFWEGTALPGICEKVLDWVPLGINIMALLWAFVSPSYENYGNTWREF